MQVSEIILISSSHSFLPPFDIYFIRANRTFNRFEILTTVIKFYRIISLGQNFKVCYISMANEQCYAFNTSTIGNIDLDCRHNVYMNFGHLKSPFLLFMRICTLRIEHSRNIHLAYSSNFAGDNIWEESHPSG